MKKTILTILILFLYFEPYAQNYKKIEPYIETITKYEKFAAKAVDDYSISIYQDSRREGVRETLLSKLREDKLILSKNMFNVNNDTSYTEGLIDFISLIIEYFEKNTGVCLQAAGADSDPVWRQCADLWRAVELFRRAGSLVFTDTRRRPIAGSGLWP